MGEKKDFTTNAALLTLVTTLTLIILGVIQVILGEFFSKSVALTANGIDCIGDGFVSGVVWIGLRIFRKPADEKFHYGYYKMENLASIVAAVVMIILAGYIIFRSYNQLVEPVQVKIPIVGAFVALSSSIIAIVLGIFKFKRCKKSNMSSVKLEAFNTIKDGTSSGLAVIALVLSSFGYVIADAVVGFIIAAIIITIGFAAIKEGSYMLVDACNGECIERGRTIRVIAESVEGVKKAHLMRLRQSGPIFQGELEIEVSCDLTIKEFNKIKNKIKKEVQQVFPEVERLTIDLTENISSK